MQQNDPNSYKHMSGLPHRPETAKGDERKSRFQGNHRETEEKKGLDP